MKQIKVKPIRKEVMDILKSEIQKLDDCNFRKFLCNELEKFNYSELIELNYFGLQKPPMHKLEMELTNQQKIDNQLNLQFIYLKHYKYNTNLSNETIMWLDMKIGKLYNRVGKLIDKKVKAKEHWQNKYGNLSTNQNEIVIK